MTSRPRDMAIRGSGRSLGGRALTMACATLRPKAALPLVRERGSHLASNRKDSLADGEVLAVLLRCVALRPVRMGFGCRWDHAMSPASTSICRGLGL